MRSTAGFHMFLFRRHCGIIFPKPKPYILLDTALLINYISHPRMMTWLRENWRFYHIRCEIRLEIKVARYSFSRSIPHKFERKLRRHKQRFGKINTTAVLGKEENWLWSGLQRHRSCHSNEMTPLPILLAAVYLGTENCSSKIVYWSIYLR